MEALFDQLIASQQARLLSRAQSLVPTITPEDLLQPMDYPLLESDPLFRHEEGILEGLLTARAAIRGAPKP